MVCNRRFDMRANKVVDIRTRVKIGRIFGAISSIVLVSVMAVSLKGQSPDGLMGFSVEAADQQRNFERIMATVPNAERMHEYHYVMTRRPHHAGTEQNYEYALYIKDRLEEFGYKTEMFKYDILIPWAGENRISLTFPETKEIVVTEPPIKEDPDTLIEGGLPPMAAYVTPGDVSGSLVYVNYGRIQDYRLLDEMGVSLEGKIVLTRYGGSPGQMRGMKVREAAKRGAVGAIIYSDPEDDGYVRGDVYPNGTWRPWEGVQRGSYLDVPIYPGDPLTPFEPSIPGVERIPMDQAETIQKIPAHPISYGEALKLLQHIGGPVVPREWQGGLPLAYHIGPGPAEVSMHIELDYQTRPVWNVFGTIEGSVEPDRVVLAGGHRDSWVLGARDPISGAVSLLETARGIAEAVEQGFRPRRSIQFSSWGGEDFFLLGSTEYGEQFADELKKNMVVYINRESYTAGAWGTSGNHSLEKFVIETSLDAPHPSGTSLYKAWTEEQKGKALHIGALGSGSDYTVFLDHLGVPSLGPGYGSGNGVYHSLYDTLVWFQKFGDPGYKYGLAQADMVGRLMMRLANAEVLPFESTGTADAIGGYLDELAELDIEGELRESLSNISSANARFRSSAVYTNLATDVLLECGQDELETRTSVLDELNGLIMQVDRDFLDERGLPRRPWYRNQLYAPGYYTGYAAKTLPGVREAMEEQQWNIAKEQAIGVVQALVRATKTVDMAGDIARTNGCESP